MSHFNPLCWGMGGFEEDSVDWVYKLYFWKYCLVAQGPMSWHGLVMPYTWHCETLSSLVQAMAYCLYYWTNFNQWVPEYHYPSTTVGLNDSLSYSSLDIWTFHMDAGIMIISSCIDYLHNGNSLYTNKRASLYWISPLEPVFAYLTLAYG